MKEFWSYWSILLFVLFLFCVSTYLLFFLSVWYIPLFLVSLIWVAEVLLFSIIFTNILDIKEGKKISKWLFSGGFILLVIGGIIAFKMNYRVKESEFLMMVSIFCLCVFVLSMFFGSMVKNKKNDEEGTYDEI